MFLWSKLKSKDAFEYSNTIFKDTKEEELLKNSTDKLQ